MTKGVVLKQTPLGESDRIVTLYTTTMGKIRAVAKGVRKPKSKLAGHLEPLTHSHISVAEGRSLSYIGEAETVESFRRIREDLQLVSKGIYIADLVDSFTVEHSPSESIFALLIKSLNKLENKTETNRILRYFEVQLLNMSGFGPELRKCVECGSVLEPGSYLFSSALGGVLCNMCKASSQGSLIRLSLNAMKIFRYFQQESLDNIDELDIPRDLLKELNRVLRNYVRYVLEKDLKSAQFMSLVSADKDASTPTSW